jgi:hypothetical protein
LPENPNGVIVDNLYSLYDALVSINVPNDKARAVVDAMERELGTTIATKTDLEMLRAAMKADLETLRITTKAEMQLLRQELLATQASKDELAGVKADLAGARADMVAMRQDRVLIRKDLEHLSTTMTVRLGSMMFVGFGMMVATLKYLQG